MNPEVVKNAVGKAPSTQHQMMPAIGAGLAAVMNSLQAIGQVALVFSGRGGRHCGKRPGSRRGVRPEDVPSDNLVVTEGCLTIVDPDGLVELELEFTPGTRFALGAFPGT